MRVLIDTNIILDFLLQREPFFQEADLMFQAIATNRVVGYVTATTLTDIFYIARRHTRSVEQAQQAVASTLMAMSVCPVDRAVLEAALMSGAADFEDAVQVACAIAQGLDALITRDADLASSVIPIRSVNELLESIEADI